MSNAGIEGRARALGFDDQGREVLTFIDGEVARGTKFIPDEGGRFDLLLPDFVWRDEVLVHLGALLRSYHDAAATFPWVGRSWCYEAREPVETICHNEVFPSNTVFRNGVPGGAHRLGHCGARAARLGPRLGGVAVGAVSCP